MKNHVSRKLPWFELARQFLGDDFFDEMKATVHQEDEPAADVYHGENEVIVVVNLPGLENVHHLDFKWEGENLIIQGEYSSPYQGYRAVVSERKKGRFQKVIPLEAKVFKKCTHARYRRGVLEIRFLKKKQTQPILESMKK